MAFVREVAVLERWPLQRGGTVKEIKVAVLGRWPLVKCCFEKDEIKQLQCPNYVSVLFLAGEIFPL